VKDVQTRRKYIYRLGFGYKCHYLDATSSNSDIRR